MAQRIPEKDLQEIEAIVAAHPQGIGLKDIARALADDIPHRTLQYRLRHLVNAGRVAAKGERRWTTYRIPATRSEHHADDAEAALAQIPISKSAAAVQAYVRQSITARNPVGYDRRFLDGYRPNVSAYLSAKERAHLASVGAPAPRDQAAGTYAKHLLNRLLIDLSWNSSRLEGNTYSLLDTRRLIAFGQAADGKRQLETQMILNHKDAIEFLVGSAEEIGFNRYTILNLHALLANNLLTDPTAPGRLRTLAVGIEKSVFHPLELPQGIEECFDQILETAAVITDPFEQAFFVMVQLPYLQPFDDVNKRVSRLAANIPFVKANMTPLSFNDVPTDLYTEAMLGIYELSNVDLLKDVFIWAYERSAARYAAVRQSLGEPDPFRLKHRDGLRRIIGDIVRGPLDKRSALARIAAWAKANIDANERETFRDVAESELLGLHVGNIARYQIRPSEFEIWQRQWIGDDEAPKPS